MLSIALTNRNNASNIKKIQYKSIGKKTPGRFVLDYNCLYYTIQIYNTYLKFYNVSLYRFFLKIFSSRTFTQTMSYKATYLFNLVCIR